MTPEFIRDELFRPFASTKGGGHGIGAYQARELLREAGGDLLVLSRPDAGTTMRLLLPSVRPGRRRTRRTFAGLNGTSDNGQAETADRRGRRGACARSIAGRFPACDVVIAHTRRRPWRSCKRSARRSRSWILACRPIPTASARASPPSRKCCASPRRPRSIVVTGNGERKNALQAVASGAYDFCEKPVEIEVLRTIIDRGLQSAPAGGGEPPAGRGAGRARRSSGSSPPAQAMLKVCRDIEKLATTNVPVLLLGESGTGKEALAQALHELGPRAKQPFVAINCGAIPENLLESELFGHERGAFTGAVKQTIGKIESANKGTLFLDEIGDLPHPLQVKLLRFLQDQIVERIGGRQQIQVDVRIVSATNASLEERVSAGHVPRRPVLPHERGHRPHPAAARARRRRDAAGQLLPQPVQPRIRPQHPRLHRAGHRRDDSHAWPGNVRELENRMKRAVVMAERRHDRRRGPGAGAGRAKRPVSICAPPGLRAEREVIADRAGPQQRYAVGRGPAARRQPPDALRADGSSRDRDRAGKALDAATPTADGRAKAGYGVRSHACATDHLGWIMLGAWLGAAAARRARATTSPTRARRMKKGDLKSAQIDLRNAVRNDPQNAEAHYWLGRVAFELGDPVAAEREATRRPRPRLRPASGGAAARRRRCWRRTSSRSCWTS